MVLKTVWKKNSLDFFLASEWSETWILPERSQSSWEVVTWSDGLHIMKPDENWESKEKFSILNFSKKTKTNIANSD